MAYVLLAHHQGKPQKSVPLICSNSIKGACRQAFSATSYNRRGRGEDRSRKCQGGAGSRAGSDGGRPRQEAPPHWLNALISPFMAGRALRRLRLVKLMDG
jgi:hypothetical protein